MTTSSALISPDGKYRYTLTRTWDVSKPPCCFIMLNPSTADASEDDPTIRRCIGYAKSFDCGSLEVVNLFAVRATEPKDMLSADDPVGPNNMTHVKNTVEMVNAEGGVVVCAWGAHGSYMDQSETVLGWIEDEGVTPKALKLTRKGLPCHPLYLKSTLTPKTFEELKL